MFFAIDCRSATWLAESVALDEVSSAVRSPSALAISASVIEPALENDVKSAFSAGSWRLEIHDGAALADLADDVVAVGLTLGACPTPRGAAALGTVLGLRQNKSESKSKSLSNWYLLCFVVVIVVPFSLPP